MRFFFNRFIFLLSFLTMLTGVLPIVALPIVIPNDRSVQSLDEFSGFIEDNREALNALLKEHGALLFRDFPLATAEDFARAVKTILQRDLMDYASGEGSRKWIAQGVYTSTEAPASFHITLHHELSCTNTPLAYIAFFCEIAPSPGTGQTLLGSTKTVTQRLVQEPEVWDSFFGKTIKYTSRHPPAGSYFSVINPTHRTWQESFETNDRQVVERICQEKGFEYHWLGDWLEVIRRAPAIRGPDEHFDHPYWFNQAHLYHANPRGRGWLNYILANLLYIVPSTRPYDVEFDDGTQIPLAALYKLYDILEEETIRFDWQKGDLLLLDNIKTLHGKAPYRGKRRILVSMIR